MCVSVVELNKLHEYSKRNQIYKYTIDNTLNSQLSFQVVRKPLMTTGPFWSETKIAVWKKNSNKTWIFNKDI